MCFRTMLQIWGHTHKDSCTCFCMLSRRALETYIYAEICEFYLKSKGKTVLKFRIENWDYQHNCHSLGWKLPHSPQVGAAASQQREPTGSTTGRREAAAQEPPPSSNPVHQTPYIGIFSVCHTFLHWQTVLHLVAPTQSTAHSTGKELWKLSKPTANNSSH